MTKRCFYFGFLCMTVGFVSQAQAVVVIDNFETPHSAETDPMAPPTASDFSFANPTLTALGVERDLLVVKEVGGGGDRIIARVNPNGQERLRHSQDSTVQGRTVVSWDGVDGSAAIDYDGLGGVDLLADGSTAFLLGVERTDLAGPVIYTVYDNDDPTGATFTTGSFSVPGLIAVSTELTHAFMSFTPTIGTTNADIFDSVGAITFEIDGQGVMGELAGRDAEFSYIRTNGLIPPGGGQIPEPTTMLIWGSLLGMAASRRIVRPRKDNV